MGGPDHKADRLIAELAAGAHGVVTRGELVRAGLSVGRSRGGSSVALC